MIGMPSVQDIINATFAEQCALDAQRAAAWARDHGTRVHRIGGIATVDVLREPLPPLAPEPEPPKNAPRVYYCGGCGKVFDAKQFKRAGMAAMQRTKHERACTAKRV